MNVSSVFLYIYIQETRLKLDGYVFTNQCDHLVNGSAFVKFHRKFHRNTYLLKGKRFNYQCYKRGLLNYVYGQRFSDISERCLTSVSWAMTETGFSCNQSPKSQNKTK